MTTSEDNNLFRDYILTGRGIGLKIVTTMALLIILAISIISSIFLTNLVNEGGLKEEFYRHVPTVKIEKGKIVEPIYNDVVWDNSYMADNPQDEIKIFANTTIDKISEMPKDVTIYITARNIYARSETDTRVYHIPDELTTTITPQKMASFLKHLFWIMGLILGFFLFIFAIIGFLIGYIPLIIVGLIVNRKLTVDAWGRAFAWPWIIVWGISLLGAVFSISTLSIPYVYLISLLITWIIGASLYNYVNTYSSENAAVLADETQSEETESEINSNEETSVEPVIAKTTDPIKKGTKESTPVVRKTPNMRTKKAVVKPKNVPVQRKSIKK